MAAHLEGRLANPDRPASGDYCPIDRAMGVIGSRSAMLLLREAAYGTTRFDDFATRIGITDAVAASRLRELVAAGLLERHPYQDPGQRTRHEYVLTDSGEDVVPVLLALATWGRKHLPRIGTPTFSHAGCDAEVSATIGCGDGHELSVDELIVRG